MSGEHGHGHGVAAGGGSVSSRYLNRLYLAVGLGLFTFVLQVTTGLLTASLALLSDSAHVLTDVLGLAMAVVAILVARRSSRRGGRTFGMYRAEVFAALVNALLLFTVAFWVLFEAANRWSNPPDVPGLPVTLVAVVGLVANLIALLALRGGAKESLNIRGAYLEVLADMLGSFGVLVSGLLLLAFDWRYADPLIGAAIGLFVLPRAWSLGRGALRILFQHAPERIDVDTLENDLRSLPEVIDVHDVHVWTLTSGMEVISAHLSQKPDADSGEVLSNAKRLLAERYKIEHATLQAEQPGGGNAGCHELHW